MKVHMFDYSEEAYDETQCNEQISIGDPLVIIDEKIVAVADTWPFAVTKQHGHLHNVSDLKALVASLESDKRKMELLTGMRNAVKIAKDLGFELNPFFQ